MDDIYARTTILLGEEKTDRLKKARVLVFGIGGVGGYAVEALARAGVGTLEFVDGDVVSGTNLNRQILSLRSVLGKKKTEVCLERISDINPACIARGYTLYYTAENADLFDFTQYDYVIDAIDMVSSKLIIAERCLSAGTPLISSMGTGGKLDPSAFRIADIYETYGCPLARVIRHELRKRGIKKLTVLFSPEHPQKDPADSGTGGRSVPGTVSYMPAIAGMMLAGKVIRDIAEAEK